ncbi:MAG: haloacid dehalogenase-like hydrolase [Desulfobacterales bacterium]|jgi:phosphoserine phosphatase
MTYAQTFDRQLVVLDLDGAVVHDHTPSELIRAGFPLEPERYEQALDMYHKECTGNAKPEEALLHYSTLARGMTLRRAIEYATFKMRFINDFETFIEMLYRKNIPVLLVSSGFSIITETVRQLHGSDRFQAVMANPLVFGLQNKPEIVISEEKLMSLVHRYHHRARDHKSYDKMVATGDCYVLSADPLKKASFIFKLAMDLNIPFQAVTYVCSNPKDQGTLFSIIRSRGRAVVFNFEESMENIIRECTKDHTSEYAIQFTTPKSRRANLRSVFEILFPDG